jgi:hypothetical protein
VKRLLLLAMLAGCSSTPKATTPVDETLSRLGHAGDIAYNFEQPGQAAEQYRAALDRARERDDAAAIADAGFNLATAQLRDNEPKAAIATAQQLRAELARRGVTDLGFDLVTATALFRIGDDAGADRLAADLSASRSPGFADSAWFLRGLIADAHGDRAGLQQALSSLSATANDGDRAELQARIAHDPASALRAADLRREALDYRGMARDLALSAQFSPDPEQSADLLLRAGRSAAAQRDFAQAKIWLDQARAKAPTPMLRNDADRALANLVEKK